MTDIMKRTAKGWEHLPLEICQQIITEVLNDAMNANHPDPPKMIDMTVTTLLITNYKLVTEDLLRPLAQLSTRVTETMDKLRTAQQELVKAGDDFGEQMFGNRWWSG